ncbi:hypothetical protein ACHAW5_002556 [Stephanodiscus triporus]|uniref:Transcription initiation factor IIF subunit alpha n=1 Tax=Stephanodiscus triporus TaxID=2934178 RepID=A0ABD3MQE2_9STRA
MGVAIRRTRAKRARRVKGWLASGGGGGGGGGSTIGGTRRDDEDNAEVVVGRNDDDDKVVVVGGGGEYAREEDTGGGGDDIYDVHHDGDDASPLNKRRYGSVIDYLEAKYVRGVMIDEYDEEEKKKRRRRKKKAAAAAAARESRKKKRKEASGDGDGDGDGDDDEEEEEEEEGEEESVDSEPSGVSVYSSDDGFIDDTLLHEEVAGQVLASNAYGMTQIEEEARTRKKRREEERRGGGGTNANDDDDEYEYEEKKSEGVGGGSLAGDRPKDVDVNVDDYIDLDHDNDGGEDSDFDDGFFVNFGDLEMAAGWGGDRHDAPLSPAEKNTTKEKVREKRKYVRKVPNAKSDEKTKKKKKKKMMMMMKKETTGHDGEAIVKKKKEQKKGEEEEVDGDGKRKKKGDDDLGNANAKKKKVIGDNGGKEVAKKKMVADADGKAMTKKKIANVDGMAADKKKKVSVEGGGKNGRRTDEKSATSPKTKKKVKVSTISVLESSTSPEGSPASSSTPNPAKATEKAAKKKSLKAAHDEDSESKSPLSPSSLPTGKTKKSSPPEISKEKAEVNTLRGLYKRRYGACVKQIKEMTTDDLPRKARNKNTMKVSVNIPPDKEIGDDITFGCVREVSGQLVACVCLACFFFFFSCASLTRNRLSAQRPSRFATTDEKKCFSNPNVPGQKLKVQIPKNADMEKRTFVVAIPTPKVKEAVEFRRNNFSREFRVALHSYSCAYDDWCDAEGKYNETLPAVKRKQFKPVMEKLKKFDEMLGEFPKNLATPIDVSYLRTMVRMERSRRQRSEKRKSGEGGDANVATKQQSQHVEIHVPQKGTDFPFIVFDRRDFPED